MLGSVLWFLVNVHKDITGLISQETSSLCSTPALDTKS